jgi:hypothetical protein
MDDSTGAGRSFPLSTTSLHHHFELLQKVVFPEFLTRQLISLRMSIAAARAEVTQVHTI